MAAMKDKRSILRNVGIIFIVISLFLVAWLLWPYSRESREISFEPGEITIELESASNQAATELTFPDGLRLILEWNPIIRKGSTETIHFQVIPDKLLNGSASFNPLDDYSIMLKTRLDMTDVIMDPSGESGIVYSQENKSEFNWKVTPLVPGDLQGTTWFFLVVFPANGDALTEKAVSAQNFDINVISILGIDTVYLWVMAIIIALAGLLFFKGCLPWKQRRDGFRKKNTLKFLK